MGAGAATETAASWRGLSLDERFFLKIALKNGLVGEAEVAEVLRARAELHRRGRRRTVQEIALDAGLLAPEQVDAIHQAQAASQVIRLDSLYADIALRLGYASREQLERMFQLQRERAYKVRVGEMLVDRGILTSAQHRRVLAELLSSLRADEKDYMRAIGLKGRLVPDAGADPEERLRLMQTQAGGQPAAAAGAEPSAPAVLPGAPLAAPPAPALAGPEPEGAAAAPSAAPAAAAPAAPRSAFDPSQTLQDWLGRSSDQGTAAGGPAGPGGARSSSPQPAASQASGGGPADSFLRANLEAIRRQGGVAARPAGVPPGARPGGGSARARRRRGGRAAQPPRGRRAPQPMSAFLESAIAAIAEEPELAGSSGAGAEAGPALGGQHAGGAVRCGDIAAVEDDLRDVEELIEKGYRSFRELARRSSDASRGEGFSTERYLRQRRRRTLMVRLAVGAALALVLVPAAIGIVLARRNVDALGRAEQALAQGELQKAEQHLAAAGSFWVGERRREELERKIALQRALAPLLDLRAAGRHDEALQGLRALRARFAERAAELEQLERSWMVEHALSEGDRLEAEGALAAAVQLYERTARAVPEAEAPRTRLEAIRTRLRSEIAQAERAAASRPGDEAAVQRQVAAWRRYCEVFAGESEEIERKLLEHELGRHLREAEQALAERRYEQALAQLYRANEVAERLERPAVRTEIEEKARRARRLAQFQASFTEGQRHEQAGRYQEAIQAYRRAGAWIDDGDPRAKMLAARLAACERALASAAQSSAVERLWAEAIEAMRHSRAEQAQAALRALLEVDPGHERARRALEFAARITDMVYVPAGPAIIGTDEPDARAANPRRTVRLPAFFIDRFEVRNRQFLAMVQASGEAPPPHWRPMPAGGGGGAPFPPEQADHPVVQVSWHQAQRYAAWAGKRLPDELEWEKAARGPDGRTWPWGEDTERRRVHVQAASSEQLPVHTRPVGTAPDDESPYGCMDMAGNVSEWTGSAFLPYPGGDPRAAEFSEQLKVIRGGSWRYGLHYARLFHRDRARPEERFPEVGFRCALDIPEWLPELR